MVSKRGHREDALLQVGGEQGGLDVIAGKPQVVWVRSLVPKEKKSAESAIRLSG